MANQERLNRSHGQKLRRIDEVQGKVIDVVLAQQQQIAQNTRDIKVIKSTLNDRSKQNQ